MPINYEQASPLARRKARYGLSFIKLKLAARLLLFPKSLATFGDPEKQTMLLGEKEKQCIERMFCCYSKTEAMSALL